MDVLLFLAPPLKWGRGAGSPSLVGQVARSGLVRPLFELRVDPRFDASGDFKVNSNSQAMMKNFE
jgi:hypothetical protein